MPSVGEEKRVTDLQHQVCGEQRVRAGSRVRDQG